MSFRIITRMLRGVALICVGVPTVTLAQNTAFERHLPPAVAPTAAPLTAEGGAVAGDRTPFGVNLASVELMGEKADASATGAGDIRLTGLDARYKAPLRAALEPYLGQPLSSDLIAKLQSAVAGVWREAGYPFMSVTVPPQDITEGVLRLRVVEFRAGDIRTPSTAAQSLRPQIRQQSGAEIAAEPLSEDLLWLNRNPFRQVGAVFSQGQILGQSDITFEVTESRPYSMYLGWNNHGHEATGEQRFSIGGGVWWPKAGDMTLSWRATRSEEMWEGEPFKIEPDKSGYLSFAARLEVPLGPRSSLSVAPNYVISNEFDANGFGFENKTLELPILYTSAVSNFMPGRYWGDLSMGFEPKFFERKTRFDGDTLATGKAALVNFVLGWSKMFEGPKHRSQIDVAVKVNLDGSPHDNTTSAWNTFTGGRVSDHRYSYMTLHLVHWQELSSRLAWSAQVYAQAANAGLPDSERLGLGGLYAVRGYDGGDLGVDTGVVWRNELRAATGFVQPGAYAVVPFALLDLGWGKARDQSEGVDLASAGLGFEYQSQSGIRADATAAVALAGAGETKSGDWILRASLNYSF